MRVIALTSFVGHDSTGKKYRIAQGQEFDLPAGVDWLTAGFVVEARVAEPAQPAQPEIKKFRGKRDGS